MQFNFLCKRYVYAYLIAICVLAGGMNLQGQVANSNFDETQDRIDAHLAAGEFPLALSLATSLPKDSADLCVGKISEYQFGTSSPESAFASASMIQNDLSRSQLLSTLASRSDSAIGGQHGGVTEADFTPLIDLITNTVASDSWLDSGTGLGTIQAYPSGVFVDSTGTLQKIKIDSRNTSSGIRENAFVDSGNRQPQIPTEFRKISLTRLERDAQLLVAQGKPIDEVMQNLAGLTEVKYLMAYPETGDIVIAGPAGPWKKDSQNRSVNIDSGKPVLQLDDLVVCLRNAWQNNGKFGCAITPRQANLAATKNYLATTKLKGNRWSKQLQEVLGQQDVEVFGIDSRTHAARILVEADYRMKLIGMGLEPSIPSVPSYFERIQLGQDGSPLPIDVARWWFTLNYDDVFANEDHEVFTFSGSGVKVLSESEMLDDAGNRIHTGQSHGPTNTFARDFTKHFSEIAAEYPIYRELKNVFDMALIANLIRQQNLIEKVNWHLTFFGPEQSAGMSYRVKLDNAAKQVESVMNQRIITARKQSSTLRHTIVGVSGGISYDVHDAISPDKLKPMPTSQSNGLIDSRPEEQQRNWWWD